MAVSQPTMKLTVPPISQISLFFLFLSQSWLLQHPAAPKDQDCFEVTSWTSGILYDQIIASVGILEVTSNRMEYLRDKI